jgi:hypothetical protein
VGFLKFLKWSSLKCKYQGFGSVYQKFSSPELSLLASNNDYRRKEGHEGSERAGKVGQLQITHPNLKAFRHRDPQVSGDENVSEKCVYI